MIEYNGLADYLLHTHGFSKAMRVIEKTLETETRKFVIKSYESAKIQLLKENYAKYILAKELTELNQKLATTETIQKINSINEAMKVL